MKKIKKFFMKHRKVIFSIVIIAVIALCLSRFNIETVAEHDKRIADSKEPPVVIIEETGSTEESEETVAPSENDSKITPSEPDNEEGEDGENAEEAPTTTEQPEDESGKTDSEITHIPTATPVLMEKPETGITTVSPTISPTELPTKIPTKIPTKTPAATPGENEKKDEYISVAFKIGCEKVLGDDALKTEAEIPEDGIWFSGNIKVKDGSSVYQVLKAVCEAKNIKYVNESGENSAYISSIGGLKAFECGKESGWKYKVNGNAPNVGSSDYYLSEGDYCEWYYVKNIMD